MKLFTIIRLITKLPQILENIQKILEGQEAMLSAHSDFLIDIYRKLEENEALTGALAEMPPDSEKN
jgi:hypothetical protein